jgi:GT2 family glycosyltransferase
VYRLSIIIPVLDDNEQFEDTLVSVLQNQPADSEVLIVHAGGYGDPYQLRGEVRFVEVERNASLVAMLNAACREADGELIHLLLPGVLAEHGWSEAAVERFEDPNVAAVAPVIVDVEDPHCMLAAGVRYTLGGRRVNHGAGQSFAREKRLFRRKIHGPLLQAAFYRKSLLSAVGGFDERCGDAWADVDLGLSLTALGFRSVSDPDSVVSANAAVTRSPVGYRAGRGAERTFWRHVGGRAWLPSLALHPFVVLGSLLGSWNRAAGYTHLLGRAVAACRCLGHASHTRRLRELSDSLDEEVDVEAERSGVPDELSIDRRCDRDSLAYRRAA